MKLNSFRNRTLFVLLSFTLFLCSNTFSLSTKRSNKTSSKKWDIKSLTLAASASTYEADLMIENKAHNTTEELPLYIQKKKLDEGNYGFEITLKDPKTAIKSQIFFPLGQNNYFLSFRTLTSGFDCVGDAFFSNLGMVYVFKQGGETINVSFRVPNSWAFSEGNSMINLCRGLSNQYDNYFINSKKSKDSILEAHQKARNLEYERSKNINDQNTLTSYINDLEKIIKADQDKLESMKLNIDVLDTEIKEITSKMNPINDQISKNTDLMNTMKKDIASKQKTITENENNDIFKVKIITDEEINNIYSQVDRYVLDIINLLHDNDTVKQTFLGYYKNVKNNVDKLYESLSLKRPAGLKKKF